MDKWTLEQFYQSNITRCATASFISFTQNVLRLEGNWNCICTTTSLRISHSQDVNMREMFALQRLPRGAVRRDAALEARAVSVARVGDAPPGLVQPVRGPRALRGARATVAQTGALLYSTLHTVLYSRFIHRTYDPIGVLELSRKLSFLIILGQYSNIPPTLLHVRSTGAARGTRRNCTKGRSTRTSPPICTSVSFLSINHF